MKVDDVIREILQSPPCVGYAAELDWVRRQQAYLAEQAVDAAELRWPGFNAAAAVATNVPDALRVEVIDQIVENADDLWPGFACAAQWLNARERELLGKVGPCA